LWEIFGACLSGGRTNIVHQHGALFNQRGALV
jgi:hypothetical protein